VPILALAKEHEHIFLPGCAEPLVLPETSPALHLLRHIRDEAHRFAVGYHRLLRRKRARRSELDDIPGVDPVRRTALLRVFGSVARVREAALEQLTAVPEIGPAAAGKIWEHFHGVPVDLDGLTAFTRRVLTCRRDVPPGMIISYGAWRPRPVRCGRPGRSEP
jgi:excinuclease ABC subunit C